MEKQKQNILDKELKKQIEEIVKHKMNALWRDINNSSTFFSLKSDILSIKQQVRGLEAAYKEVLKFMFGDVKVR